MRTLTCRAGGRPARRWGGGDRSGRGRRVTPDRPGPGHARQLADACALHLGRATHRRTRQRRPAHPRGDGHTAYARSSCVRTAVAAFLTTGTAPAAGLAVRATDDRRAAPGTPQFCGTSPPRRQAARPQSK
ncbi:alpha/beta hydrolase [Kitasatospora sp. NPDC091207]|uniref:alpha/beta hydrolase n=1 Tax=Kitasatospora sp. NPDC091207 TaxID=3364083 RepID=UPI003803FDE0